jgi:hypothetical protein
MACDTGALLWGVPANARPKSEKAPPGAPTRPTAPGRGPGPGGGDLHVPAGAPCGVETRAVCMAAVCGA